MSARKPATTRHRTRSCLSKRRYRSHEQAVRVMHKALSQRCAALRVYACEHCRGWHLTHWVQS